MKIIDLTKPITQNKNDSFYMRVKIRHKSHFLGKLLLPFMGMNIFKLPRGFRGWADDAISLGVHSVTHIDAPWHYAPETLSGEKCKSIEALPLEWFYGDGIVIDMSHKKDMEPITKSNLETYVEDHQLQIKEGTIVLIRTGRDKYIGTREYPQMGTGVSAEATRWLVDQGVHVTGIDQWGWDRPLFKSGRLSRKTKNPDLFWEGHRVGIETPYCHIEQIVGLDQLPKDGFKVMAMPLPLKGCSASPIRLIAMVEDES